MGRRLILDTNALIAYERGTIDRSALDSDELAVAAISIAAYRVGIELADTVERAARARPLTAIESAVDVLAYTDATAVHHARLIAHVRRTGAPRGAHDLIIAAHAAETGRTVVTRDLKAGLAGLPGVLAIEARRTDRVLDARCPAHGPSSRSHGLQPSDVATCVGMTLALYYPWMHFQHDDWVKLALLTWDRMVRIRSTGIWDRDSDTVRRIAAETDFLTDRKPSPPALSRVASTFLRILSEHREALVKRYGDQQASFTMPASQVPAPNRLDDGSDRQRFWIYVGPHLTKVTDILRAALLDAGLAVERNDGNEAWLGMHPRLGAVYTACLADSIATANLLSPATDDPRMHRAVGALDQAVALLLDDAPPSTAINGVEPDAAYLHVAVQAVLCPTDIAKVSVSKLIAFRDRYTAELSAFRAHVAGLAPELARVAAVESPDIAHAHLEALYRQRTRPQLDDLRGALRGMGIDSTVGVLGLKVDAPATAGTLVGGAAAATGHLAVAGTAVAMTVLPYLAGRVRVHRQQARTSPVAYLLAAERDLSGRSLLDRIRAR